MRTIQLPRRLNFTSLTIYFMVFVIHKEVKENTKLGNVLLEFQILKFHNKFRHSTGERDTENMSVNSERTMASLLPFPSS